MDMRVLKVNQELLLRPLQESDAQPLFAITQRNREHLRTYLPWVDQTTRVEHSRAYIRGGREEWSAGVGAHFGIFYQQHLIGHISLTHIKPEHSGEIGYWIAADMTRRGLMTLCLRSVVLYAFNEVHLVRLLIRCRTDNLASAKVARRLGFIYEGRERLGEKYGDTYYDLDCYGLTALDLPR